MSRRLKLTVAYDGAPFAGWQSQSHRNTVQDHLQRAFERISGRDVRVHGAGRTDAGVHAFAQCAHVDELRGTLSFTHTNLISALPILSDDTRASRATGFGDRERMRPTLLRTFGQTPQNIRNASHPLATI